MRVLEDFDFQQFVKYINRLSIGDISRYMGAHPPAEDNPDFNSYMIKAYNDAVIGIIRDYNSKYSKHIPLSIDCDPFKDICTILKDLGIDVEDKIWSAVRLWSQRRH